MNSADREAIRLCALNCEYWAAVGVDAVDAGNMQSAADAAAWSELAAISAFSVATSVRS